MHSLGFSVYQNFYIMEATIYWTGFLNAFYFITIYLYLCMLYIFFYLVLRLNLYKLHEDLKLISDSVQDQII